MNNIFKIIYYILTKKNFAFFAYDNKEVGNTGAVAYIKDDTDTVFLDVISDYTNNLNK